ncbi:MAG: DNA gyrase inhibitor YacG, partial [Acetobacteraceae bacterium]
MTDRAATRSTCPICARPTEARWRPFCSRRCADIDLGRWFSGGYRLPGTEPADPS